MTTPRTTIISTPRCFHCGKGGTLEITEEEHTAYFVNKVLAQRAFPTRTPEFREQIITGTHPACWDEMFKGEEG